MIEIGTRVTVSTIAGTFAGTVHAYDPVTKVYKVLLDDDGVTPPEFRIVGSTVVTPITEE
jgi:hypothetical protein